MLLNPYRTEVQARGECIEWVQPLHLRASRKRYRTMYIVFLRRHYTLWIPSKVFMLWMFFYTWLDTAKSYSPGATNVIRYPSVQGPKDPTRYANPTACHPKWLKGNSTPPTSPTKVLNRSLTHRCPLSGCLHITGCAVSESVASRQVKLKVGTSRWTEQKRH